MSILVVNFKQLYQRPGLWLVYVIVGLLVFASLVVAFDEPLAGQGKFMGLVMLQFLIGLCTASLPAEILTKPFSYCLPGHRATPGKFLSWVGAATSIPGSLVFLAYPALHWWEWAPVICCSAFFAGLILYWIGVGLAFGVGNSSLIVGFAWLPLLGVRLFGLHAAAERTIVDNPLAIIALGLSTTGAAWIWLGNPDRARRLCATSRICLFDAWNRDKILAHSRKRAAVKSGKSGHNLDLWVERFFVSRMESCRILGLGRYIWGGLYTTFGLALSRWKASLTSLVFVLAIVLYLSYSRPGTTDILFVMVGIMAMYMRLPVQSNMMIPGGRNERFVAAFVLAGTITVLVTVALVAMAALSAALAPIMPNITIRGKDLTFHTTSLRLVTVPAIVVPIVLALRLIFRSFAALVAVVVFFTAVFIFGVGTSKSIAGLLYPTLQAGLLIVSWLVLIAVLRQVCMTQSLVGQSRAN